MELSDAYPDQVVKIIHWSTNFNNDCVELYIAYENDDSVLSIYEYFKINHLI